MTEEAERLAQLAEASLFLRWAAMGLTAAERDAVEIIALGLPPVECARRREITRACLWERQRTALAKMRHRLQAARICSSADVVSE